jgi:hypothetical protein
MVPSQPRRSIHRDFRDHAMAMASIVWPSASDEAIATSRITSSTVEA